MSIYRTLLAALAAIVIASPVFADDAANAGMTETMPAAQSDNTQTLAEAAASSTAAATTETSATTETTKININTAPAKELLKVKGINPSKARAIIAYRKKHGNFKTIDDLANVKGFKKLNSNTLKSIEEQLTVE